MSKYTLPDSLYEFQREDSEKAASGGNWLLLHEMGTGKTPMTLNVIERNKYQIPLIVCPNSLRFEWARQIEEWTDEKSAISKQNIYTRLGDIVHSFQNGTKYKIINYETLRNKENFEILSVIPFDVIVFDEIHKLRNPKTKLARAVWEFLKLQENAKILGLSGSPIMNYPNDLYVPLSVVQPGKYERSQTAWRMFMYRYCLWSEGRHGPYIYGTRNLAELREQTSPFILRRLKKDVLKFLPDKYYQRPELVMKEDQRKLYDQMERELSVLLDTGEPLWAPCVLAALTRLRQINLDPKILGVTCSSAKTEFLLDIVEGELRTEKQPEGSEIEPSSTNKLVIFSCFEKYIDLLSTVYFTQVPHVVVSGQVPPDERMRRVKQFQEDPSIKLFLGTIQTAGEGITLTASSTVILADRWWNEPTNQQAVDRLHRIGQKNAVQVFLPVVKNSIDEYLNEVLGRKYEASQEYYQENVVRESLIAEAFKK